MGNRNVVFQRGAGAALLMLPVLLLVILGLALVQSGRDYVNRSMLATQIEAWDGIQSTLSILVRSQATIQKSAAKNPGLRACLEANATASEDCVDTEKNTEYPMTLIDGNDIEVAWNDQTFSDNGSACRDDNGTKCPVRSRLWYRAICPDAAVRCDRAVAIILDFTIESSNLRKRISGLPVHDHVVLEVTDNNDIALEVNTPASSTSFAFSTSTRRAVYELARRRVEKRIALQLQSPSFLALNRERNQVLQRCLEKSNALDCIVSDKPTLLRLRDSFGEKVAGKTVTYDPDGAPCHSGGLAAICPIRARVFVTPTCLGTAQRCDVAASLQFRLDVTLQSKDRR